MKTVLYLAAATGFFAFAAGCSPLLLLTGALNLVCAWSWDDEDDDEE